jgi:hypothetical protein
MLKRTLRTGCSRGCCDRGEEPVATLVAEPVSIEAKTSPPGKTPSRTVAAAA